jgi:hypothetical protein
LRRVTTIPIIFGFQVSPKTGIQFQVRIHFRQEFRGLGAREDKRDKPEMHIL